MGILQRACETYDAHKNLAGQEIAGHAMLLPIFHIMTSANIEITINSEGEYISSRLVGKDEPKIAIPVTEKSGGRTSSPCAHPLCDQVGYVAGCKVETCDSFLNNLSKSADFNSRANQKLYHEVKEKTNTYKLKHKLYFDELSNWANSDYSHEKVVAVKKYIEKDTILEDLVNSGCIKLDEYGMPEKDKDIVCWQVNGVHNSGPTWTDTSLFESFISFNNNSQKDTEKVLCMITGEEDTKSDQHPKGVISMFGNAKLISSNDNNNFTYRGRFVNSNQAVSISYIASQKAHNVIRWLSQEQSFRENFGGRIILCWNPNGKKIIKPSSPILRRTKDVKIEPSNYKDELYNTIMNYKKENKLDGSENVVITALDAATTGRLSVTYYSELPMSDFIERIKEWDETTAWYNSFFGVESPALWEYVDCAFGIERNGYFEVDDKVKAQQMQKMISIKISGGLFPEDIERALVNKASNLLPFGINNRKKLLFIACSAIKKYRKDRYGEVWEMSLDPNKNDISYQYGRLLAVMEKIESDTYSDNSERETNAIRMQSVFSKRPQYATKIIMEQLKKAYMSRLNHKIKTYYEKLIGEIMEKISMFSDEEQVKALGDTYLLGYYLQKNNLYTKKNNKEEEEN